MFLKVYHHFEASQEKIWLYLLTQRYCSNLQVLKHSRCGSRARPPRTTMGAGTFHEHPWMFTYEVRVSKTKQSAAGYGITTLSFIGVETRRSGIQLLF